MRNSKITQVAQKNRIQNIVDIRHNFVNLVSLSFEKSRVPGQMKWTPPVRIRRKNSNFTLKSELPGFSAKDIRVSVLDNYVTFEGKNSHYEDEKNQPSGVKLADIIKFRRTFELPEMIDENAVRATMKSGVLNITLPVKEKEAKKIEVQFEEE